MAAPEPDPAVLWVSLRGRSELLRLACQAEWQELPSVDALAELWGLVADGAQLWGIDHRGDAVVCRRADSGELLARVPVAPGPNRMAVGPDVAWVHHLRQPTPMTVISRTDFSVQIIDVPGVPVAARGSEPQFRLACHRHVRVPRRKWPFDLPHSAGRVFYSAEAVSSRAPGRQGRMAIRHRWCSSHPVPIT